MSHWVRNSLPLPFHWMQSESESKKSWLFMQSLGGLAYPSDREVQRIALKALDLYDRIGGTGSPLHVQTRRFLSKDWRGLSPISDTEADPADPPLRPLAEALASGETTLSDFVDSPSPAAESLLHWISAFRHAPGFYLSSSFVFICVCVSDNFPRYAFVHTLCVRANHDT